MPREQINELIGLPWQGLSKQFNAELDNAIRCFALKHWQSDTGERVFKIGSVKIARYRAYMQLDSATFASSLEKPPGYEKLSLTQLVLACPLQGTWGAAATFHFTSRFRVWNKYGTILSVTPKLTQRIVIRKVKVRGELNLNRSEFDRPRLSQALVTVKLQVALSGFISGTITIPATGFEFDPPDTYWLRIPLKGTLVKIPGVAGARFDGTLVLTVMPFLEVGIEGALTLSLVRISHGHRHGMVQADLPFKFNIQTPFLTEDLLREYLPSPGGLPRAWGEHPPLEVIQRDGELELPPADYDFINPALEIEQATLPSDASGNPIPTGQQAPHHVPYGLVYEIRHFCDRSPNLVTVSQPSVIYEGFQDTATWTGHYLAAESFRYAVTHSPESLARVRFVLGGIEKLFEVTGVKGLFARAALPESSPFDTDPHMCNSTFTPGTECDPGEDEQYYYTTIKGEPWCGFGRGKYPTSRDAYMGVMLGLAYTYVLVPDPAIQKTIQQLVTEALEFLINENHWNVPTPPDQKIKTSFIHEFHMQLAILRLGKTVNPSAFGALYDHFALAADYSWIPIWGTTFDPITKYFKFNLSHAAMSILLFLEDKLSLRQLYGDAFRILRRAVRHHRNAYFNLVRVISELAADRPSAINEPSGFNPQHNLKEETLALLRDWLVHRDCLAGPLGLPTERPPDPAYLKKLVSDDFVTEYVPVGETQAICDVISLYALPVHKRPGNGMDFAWQRPPFATAMTVCRPGDRPRRGKDHRPKIPFVDGGIPGNEDPGIDYLLPVWMAAYLGIISYP